MPEYSTRTDQHMTPAEAGRVLGITSDAVKLHDDVLQPERTASGRRLYLRSKIDAYSREREAAKAARATSRHGA
jgi:hypothetical protein